MSIDLWGLQDPIHLTLPAHRAGYVYLAVLVLLALGMAVRSWRSASSVPQSLSRGWQALLLVAAPLAAALLWLRLPLVDLPPLASGASGELIISPLHSIPWMLAAGWLGGWQAMLAAFVGGWTLALGGAGGLLTPWSLSLQAAIFSWLIRRNYPDQLGHALRLPLVSALLASLAIAVLAGFEWSVYQAGELAAGVYAVLAGSGLLLISSFIPALLAGGAATIARRRWPQLWVTPARLHTAPYLRSVSSRLISAVSLVMVLVALLILGGSWLQSRSWIQGVLEEQMLQRLQPASESVPSFIQNGRSLTREYGSQLALGIELAALEPSLRSSFFFTDLALFDRQGRLVDAVPLDFSKMSLPLIEQAVGVVLQGVAQEVYLPSATNQPSNALVFLAPVIDPSTFETAGAVAGWTDLQTHPQLQTLATALGSFSPGAAQLLRSSGEVILGPAGAALDPLIDIAGSPKGVFFSFVDGAGRSYRMLVQPVGGYSWYVVAWIPEAAIGTLTVRQVAPTFLVLALVGLLGVLALVILSRRISDPLGELAQAAEAIALGDLAQPLEPGAQAALGRAGHSFERMRQRLRVRFDEMEVLLNVQRELSTSFDIDQSIRPVLDRIRRLTGADLVRLILTPLASPGWDGLRRFGDPEDAGIPQQLDEQILHLSQQRGRFQLENPGRARAVLDLSALQTPLETLLSLPVAVDERFLGTLWLGYRASHLARSGEMDLLTLLAAQIGASLSAATHFQEARREYQRLLTVIDATPSVVIVTEAEGRISLANQAAGRFLRLAPAKAIGEAALSVVNHPELRRLLAEGPSEAAAELNVDGDIFHASLSDLAGEGAGQICVLWEISHYKKLDALKSEFVATVSHDLRLPLNLMRGYGTVLSMSGPLNTQQKEFVAKILDTIEQMSHLVEDLLDLGRLESGQGLKLESVAVEDLIRQVIARYRPQSLTKRVALETRFPENNLPILADPTLLRKAIANLVDNALKYSQKDGRVLIETRQEEGMQFIRVEDQGVGIAPADQARLFEQFYQVRDPEQSAEQGSGLGLSIVRSIVERHGGSVRLQSELGIGSTFTLQIPLRQPTGD